MADKIKIEFSRKVWTGIIVSIILLFFVGTSIANLGIGIGKDKPQTYCIELELNNKQKTFLHNEVEKWKENNKTYNKPSPSLTAFGIGLVSAANGDNGNDTEEYLADLVEDAIEEQRLLLLLGEMEQAIAYQDTEISWMEIKVEDCTNYDMSHVQFSNDTGYYIETNRTEYQYNEQTQQVEEIVIIEREIFHTEEYRNILYKQLIEEITDERLECLES